MAGRSMSRCASTDARSEAVEVESTCCTPLSLSPNAACRPQNPCHALCVAATCPGGCSGRVLAHTMRKQCDWIVVCSSAEQETGMREGRQHHFIVTWCSVHALLPYGSFQSAIKDSRMRSTWRARSMPIFIVPAEEGQVPHAPCIFHSNSVTPNHASRQPTSLLLLLSLKTQQPSWMTSIFISRCSFQPTHHTASCF